MAKRDYGTGSVYQRGDGRWIATLEAGWTAKGTRRRVLVSARTEREVRKKLRDKRLQIEKDGLPSTGARVTVKKWSETWLADKLTTLRPKAYNAAASPVRKWIVPTIGHRRLDELTPADVRAVQKAQRQAGRKPAAIAATQRVLFNMLRAAIVEGHQVPLRVLLTKGPGQGVSDRAAPTAAQVAAVLAVASTRPDGLRWAFALLNGARQGECLGLTRDALDLEAGRVALEWQLQALPYLDRKDKARGFRVPDDHEARHLVDAWHLVRPKSAKGVRSYPLHPALAAAFARLLAETPTNPYGLVWTIEGRPINDKQDRAAWQEVQELAGISHPSGRPFHVHEMRNFTATRLRDTGAAGTVITSILGHASITTSEGYMTAHEEAKRAALVNVAAELLPASWSHGG